MNIRNHKNRRLNMSGKGWWNNAISGLESRLDTILAEDEQAAKAKATEGAAKAADTEKAPVDKKLAVEPGRYHWNVNMLSVALKH